MSARPTPEQARELFELEIEQLRVRAQHLSEDLRALGDPGYQHWGDIESDCLIVLRNPYVLEWLTRDGALIGEFTDEQLRYLKRLRKIGWSA